MEQGACILSLSLQPVIAIEFQNNSTVLGERGMSMKIQNDPYIFRGYQLDLYGECKRTLESFLY
jgi:hypothetical protein